MEGMREERREGVEGDRVAQGHPHQATLTC